MVRILEKTQCDVRVDRIILDLHMFLQAFPTVMWKQKTDDVPLRTVKTILHAIVKYRGHKVSGSQLLSCYWSCNQNSVGESCGSDKYQFKKHCTVVPGAVNPCHKTPRAQNKAKGNTLKFANPHF